RHTRSDRDWSSDVCSSDLLRDETSISLRLLPRSPRKILSLVDRSGRISALPASGGLAVVESLRFDLDVLPEADPMFDMLHPRARSEERRVGKECRCWRGG